MKKFFIRLWSWLQKKDQTESKGPAVGQSTDAGKASKTIYPSSESSKKFFATAKPKGFFKNGKAKKPMTAREMYLEQWGNIPKGKVVHHIDGDETNFHITNLGVILRSDLINKNIHDK